MKFIRWFFPVVIIIMAIILWWVYLGMPKITLNHMVIQNPLQEKVDQLSQEQAKLSSQVTQLQTQINQAAQAFTLPEAYYYLNIAHLHLTVFQDVNTALKLMHWVQQRFITSNAPIALKEALSADISALQAVNVPDINNITSVLNEAKAQIMTLPLRDRQTSTSPAQPIDTTTSNWQKALSDAWGELKTLIRIQPRNTSIDYVLFDETILRETVRVELERASIAAIIGQTDLYQASLAQAVLALQQFFAVDPSVQQTINHLQNLTTQTLRPQIPQADRALMWLQTQTAEGMLL